jgi:hypothetical protein
MNEADYLVAGILLFIIIWMLSMDVQGYVISRNRVIYQPKNLSMTTTTLYQPPKIIVLDENKIDYLNNRCRPEAGTMGYQAGYADACDWLLSEIGVRKYEYKSRPSAAVSMTIDKTQYIKIPIVDNVFHLNNSLFRVQLFDNGVEKILKNCTGESLNAPYDWRITYRYVRQNTSKYYDSE